MRRALEQAPAGPAAKTKRTNKEEGQGSSARGGDAGPVGGKAGKKVSA